MPRRNYTTLLCALLYAILCCTLSSPVVAQQVAVAQVSGQVTDPSGAAVVDATIKMTETEKAVVHTTTTNSTGDYVLPGLPVGPYGLEISKQGFKTHRRSGMVLQVNDHVTLNVTLQVGMATETVEVSGAEMLVQTESPAISSVIESQRITELPLNGRLATQLVLYSGAAVDAPAGDEKGSKSFISSQTYSVAGGQHNGTNYLLDGADWNNPIFNVNNPFPIPDAMQEFSVETSALPARNGIHPGGAVNAVTKSGTNQIHGSAFEYYRSGNFNAIKHNFLATGVPVQDNLLRNQWGGTIGGKIISNKLFYFGAYQGTRAKSSGSATTKTATQAMLNGDFSIVDGTTCANKTLKGGFAGNKIKPALFDPASVKLFTGGYVPISSDPCGTYTYGIYNINNEDQATGKIDWAKTDKHMLYFRYMLDDYRQPPPFDAHNLLVTTTSGNWERVQGFTLGETYTFNAAVTNAFHFAFNRSRIDRGADPAMPVATDLGVNQYEAIDHFMQLTIGGGYFNIGCGTCVDAHFNANTWQFADDLDWLKGKHHFAFGANVMRNQTNTMTGYMENGSATWNGSFTNDNMADFLLGPYSGFGQSRAQKVNYRLTQFSLYAQDTYKVNPRLTVTAGLRWEPTIWPSDLLHRGSQFSMSDFLNNVHSTVYPNAPAGMMYYGDPGIPAAFTNNHLANFSPRIGIAFDPWGKGTSSLRAGYGILYDSSMVWLSQRLTSNPPVVNEIDTTAGCGTMSNPWLNYSLATGCGSAGANQNPFPGGTIGSPSSFPGNTLWVTLPPNMQPMYMEQYTLSYEQQFLKDWAYSVAYMGSRTLHIPVTMDLNVAQASLSICGALGGCTTGNETKRRLFNVLYPSTDPRNPGAYGAVWYADDHGHSSYNAMLASLKHSFTHGLNFQANYTWSKCLSTGDFNGDIRTTTFMVQNNPELDYGQCNIDMRHIFNSTLVAVSSVHGTGWKKWLLDGWQFAPGFRAYTGIAVNITNGNDAVSADGINLTRPELVPGQPLYLNKWLYGAANCNGQNGWCYAVFNPAAFVAPNQPNAPQQVTTANPYAYIPIQRDMLHAPGVWNVDASLSRSFQIRESKAITFRFDMFNAFNHYNPTINGQGLMGSATSVNKGFGLVTSAASPGFLPSIYDPRILQFSMKLNF